SVSKLAGDALGNPQPFHRVFEERPVDFDYQFHKKNPRFAPSHYSSPAASSSPNMMFMFCTACPAAPFTRLSMQLITTSRLPSLPSEQWMSQKLEPLTSRNCGWL